jgi:hypothetical protein
MYQLLLDQENRTWRTQPQGSKCKIIARSRKLNLAYSTSRFKMYKLLLDQENRTWRTQPQGSKCMNYC